MDQVNIASQVEPETTYIQTSKGLGLIGILLIVCLLGLSGFGTYLILQKSKLNKQITSTTQVLEAQKTQTTVQENKEVSLKVKKGFMTNKKAEQLLWTNILTKADETFPDSTKIDVTSFSGNDNGNLNFNITTTTASLDPFLDTALLLENFKIKSFFDSVFIPSITSTINEQGQEFLTYSLRTDYLKDASDANLINGTQTTTQPAVQTDSATTNATIDELRQKLQTTNP